MLVGMSIFPQASSISFLKFTEDTDVSRDLFWVVISRIVLSSSDLLYQQSSAEQIVIDQYMDTLRSKTPISSVDILTTTYSVHFLSDNPSRSFLKDAMKES